MMRLRIRNPKWPKWITDLDLPQRPWMWAVPAVLATGALAYGMTRWIAGGDVKEGDACDLEIYRNVLGSHNVAQRKIDRAWLFMPYVRVYARKFGVDPTLLAALIQTESGWNPQAGSSAGAVGLTQFVPGTAISVFRRLFSEGDWPFDPVRSNGDPQANNRFASAGVADWLDRTDPAQSVYLGAALLSQLLSRYGDVTSALAAYNAGGSVLRKPFDQWPQETRSYVNGVPRRQRWFQELYQVCGGLFA